MRNTVLRAAALALAVAVVAFVVYASSGRAVDPSAQVSPEPVAATSASAAPPAASASAATSATAATSASLPSSARRWVLPTAAPRENEWGVIGPSTKADPHAVRRAVESLAPTAAPSAR